MRDLLSWNLYLGRWFGVQLRLHVFFLLFLVLAVPTRTNDPTAAVGWYGLTAFGLLLASTLLHEIGHCLAARNLGCAPEQIMLWPLGGLVAVCPAQDPQREWMTALAGPISNLL